MALCPYSAVMCLCVVSYGCLFGMAVTFLFWPGFDPAREEAAAYGRICKIIGDSGHREQSASAFRLIFTDDSPAGSPGVESGAGGKISGYLSDYLLGAVERNETDDSAYDIPGGGGEFAAAKALECSVMNSASDLEFLASGWTKAVYRAKLWGRDVAIKTVNLNGLDFRECQSAGGSLSGCYRRVSVKILREMILLRQLRHENIVQVLGSCIPDAVSPVALITELGDPLDTITLLQLSWKDRLKLSLGMARILHRLAHSPMGSLALNEIRRQQFVLVGKTTLKLTDVDDVRVTEPSCITADDCLQRLPSEMLNESTAVDYLQNPCVEGRCVGHNEKLNVWNAGRHFIRLFLPLNAPSTLEPNIQELLEAYKTAKWNSEQILAATERLVTSFTSFDHKGHTKVNHWIKKPSPEVVSSAYSTPEG
ncbi:extracellular tyrosine-protein kinase PKDCC-like [Ischnura elegans]|uniref:extracellular tyrosine-protein kinase PKDCC-like n=1 Tax=Ischnura elegans TaxID=197161 RepID=UPI001ED8B0EB|nr:extracellular tyrosine-protein kinase PKDCC-like [Ischnura elegans]